MISLPSDLALATRMWLSRRRVVQAFRNWVAAGIIDGQVDCFPSSLVNLAVGSEADGFLLIHHRLHGLSGVESNPEYWNVNSNAAGLHQEDLAPDIEHFSRYGHFERFDHYLISGDDALLCGGVSVSVFPETAAALRGALSRPKRMRMAFPSSRRSSCILACFEAPLRIAPKRESVYVSIKYEQDDPQ